MAINVLDVQPNKVPTNPTEYSHFIYGLSKVGKTTLAYDMYGERGLFIATEDRHKALAGAMVIRVNSWVEYLTVMGQLRQPEAKKAYDAIIVDTAENLYHMLEKYVAAKWKEGSIGERDDIWGKDWTDVKNMWRDGLNMIPNLGYKPVIIGHAIQKKVQIPASGVLESDLEDVTSIELKKVKDKKSGAMLDVYEFEQYTPDLPDRAWGPINKMVDNILFINTTIDITTGQEQRVIYLRDTLQWRAGSTFNDIDPVIPLNAEALHDAMKRAIGNIDPKNTTDEALVKNNNEKIDFPAVMQEIKLWGGAFHKAGKLELLNAISNDVFGLGSKMTEASESQAELLVNALLLVQEKAEEQGITK